MSHVLKLKEPIKLGSEVIEELKFEKPKAKHFRKLPDKPAVGDMLDLAGRLCSQTPGTMDELSAEDMIAVLEVVSNFLPASRATGSTP